VESSYELGNEPLERNYRVVAQLVATQVVLSPTDLVGWFIHWLVGLSVGQFGWLEKAVWMKHHRFITEKVILFYQNAALL
jgi:hypothetical protein